MNGAAAPGDESNPMTAFQRMPMFTFVTAVPAPGGGMMPVSFLGGAGDGSRNMADFFAEAMNAQGGGGARTHPASKAAIRALASGTCTEASGAPSEPCPVCQDAFAAGDEWLRMPCGHYYHKDCLTPWLAEHNTCPTCRLEIEEEKEAEAAPQPPPVAQPPPPPQQQQPDGDGVGGSTTGSVHPLQAMLARAHEHMIAQEEERQLQAALRASLQETQPQSAVPPPAVQEPSDGGGGHSAGLEADGDGGDHPGRMGVRQLKLLLEQRGVDYSGCVERSDLLELIARTSR